MSSREVDAAMSSPTEITVAQLSRLVGLPGAPALVDAHFDAVYRWSRDATDEQHG